MRALQKDAFGTMIISYLGMVIGYLNKGLLFILLLSTDEIGLVNLIFSVGILIAQFSNLGAFYSIWKFFPFFRNKEKNHYGFLLLNLLIVTIGLIIILGGLVLFRKPIEGYYSENSMLFVDYYYLIFPIGIATVYFLVFDNYLRGLTKNILPVFLNDFVLRIILLCILGVYGFGWIDFTTFLYLFSFSHFVPTIVLAIYLFYKQELTFSIKSISVPKRFQKIIVRFSLYNYINSIGTLIVVSADMLMLASMKGLEATGVYSMMVFLISAIQVPYRSIVRTTSPIISVYWKERKMKEMGQLYKKVSSLSLVISLVLFSLIWINRFALFSFLPSEYMEGIPVFGILMIGRIVDMYAGLNGIILITSKKYKYDVMFTLLLLVLTITLNYFFIPIYGMAGAAVATAITLIIYNVLRTFFVYRFYKIHPLEKGQFFILIFIIFTLAFFEWIFPNIVHPVLDICLRVIVFLSLFIIGVYKWKLNDDIMTYINKAIHLLQSKFKWVSK